MISAVSSISALQYEAFRGSRERRPAAQVANFNFEVLPLGPQHVVLFVLVNGTIRVWDFPFEKTKREGIPSWRGKWEPKGEFPAPFGEPFHVSAADGAYFFLTDPGNVYMAEEKDGKWQTSAVWNEVARPVIAMLAESDGATAFVFGKDFYFKVAKKIELKPCRDVSTSAANDANKDLQNLVPTARLAYECGRVLYEKGELKPDRPKK